jgi:HPt (histidine-containing phosphotransfer) domain-containing protein
MFVGFDGQDLPILNEAVLKELEDELACFELVCRFAADYVAMWEHRRGRLAAALEDQDREAVLDAAISMKVSSAMIGALRLARLAENVERATREGVLYRSENILTLIAEAGIATVEEIGHRYAQVSG